MWGAWRGAIDFGLILPAHRAAHAFIIRAVIGHAKIRQIVGQVFAQDAVARVPNPEDVADLGKQAHHPGVDQGCLRQLPAPDRGLALQNTGQVPFYQPLKLRVDGHRVQRRKVPGQIAEVCHVPGHDPAGLVEVVGWNQVT